MATEYSRRAAHLGIFAGVLAAVMTAFHITVRTLGQGAVDIWSLLVLTLAALVVAGGVLFFGRTGAQASPFSIFVLHAVSFVIVAGSIAAHALLVGLTGETGGGLFWMISCWGIGLLIHAFASVWSGGFADAVA